MCGFDLKLKILNKKSECSKQCCSNNLWASSHSLSSDKPGHNCEMKRTEKWRSKIALLSVFVLLYSAEITAFV